MALSVYYNINHHCFKVDYSPHIADSDKDECFINHKNLMFINQIHIPISFKDKFKIKRYRKSLKVFIADSLLNLSIKIRKTTLSNSSGHRSRSNWYMWKK